MKNTRLKTDFVSILLCISFILWITFAIIYIITSSRTIETTQHHFPIGDNSLFPNNLTEQVLDHIKEREGLRLAPYKCPANQWTIGYGHKLKKNEPHITIDSAFAETLLRYDFQLRYDMTDTNLAHNKRLALTHFIFAVGSGTYNKSKIPQLVKNNEFIGWELIKYVHYKNNKGVYVKSSNLKKSRMFELNLYYNAEID